MNWKDDIKERERDPHQWHNYETDQQFITKKSCVIDNILESSDPI